MNRGILGTRRFTLEEVAMFQRISEFYVWAVWLALVSGIPVSACADTIRNESSDKDYPRTARRLIRSAERAAWKATRRKKYAKGREPEPNPGPNPGRTAE